MSCIKGAICRTHVITSTERMARRFFLLLFLFVSLIAQAQTADERFGRLMNENRWFDLKRELKVTPADSVHPMLHKMARALTCHYFNQPDSACMVLGDLLNHHQQELGDNTLSMSWLMVMNLARTDRYAEASDLAQSLYDQLRALGVDSAQIEGYAAMARLCRMFADNTPVCQPLHPAGTYRVPMKTHGVMHRAKDRASLGHFITMDGFLNGKGSTLVFDTGAGVNIISSKQARDYGLRPLHATISMLGMGKQEGRYAMADTLRIGEMAWANVPFLIIDIQTGNATMDSIGSLLPPVIGMPIILRTQEVRLDFEHRQFVFPENPTPCPLPLSNLSLGDQLSLTLASTDYDEQPLYFHFDTGCYATSMQRPWYERHKMETLAAGKPDSVMMGGVGAAIITRGYRLPVKEFRLGNGKAALYSVMVNTGLDERTGKAETPGYLKGKEDGVLGLDALERFKLVILNLKDMYLEGIPYSKEE